MKQGNERICDACKRVIPQGAPFRSGWTTPAAGGDPAPRPSFDREADGKIRFDLCRPCVTRVEGLMGVTVEMVDPIP